MKVVTIAGARPQFVKVATVSRLLREEHGVREILVHTGQHYDREMSDVFFEELRIPRPDHSLGIGSGPHGAQTAKMLEAIEAVLAEVRPDLVLVYGDTNSTLASALAASKMRIPIAHVESGLRSFNRRMPEEVNRVITDHVSSLLFAPTATAVRNLRREGIADSMIREVGDVMYDAAVFYGRLSDSRPSMAGRLGLLPGRYVLATVHRAENTDSPERLRVIMEALSQVASELPVVLPIHPRTRRLLGDQVSPLRVIDPVGYLDMVSLEKSAAVIVTDSGGVQKEAFFHQVPCVTVRDETEWTELVELGWNRLASPEDSGQVARLVLDSIGRRGREASPYGRGDAAARIVAELRAFAGS